MGIRHCKSVINTVVLTATIALKVCYYSVLISLQIKPMITLVAMVTWDKVIEYVTKYTGYWFLFFCHCCGLVFTCSNTLTTFRKFMSHCYNGCYGNTECHQNGWYAQCDSISLVNKSIITMVTVVAMMATKSETNKSICVLTVTNTIRFCITVYQFLFK